MEEESMEGRDLDNLDDMSDEELQEAFAAGVLKPGLNIPCDEKQFKNNVSGLKLKLNELNLNINWIEKLDIVAKPAPMAPEMYDELSKEELKNIVKLKNRIKVNRKSNKEVALDDFKREMLFHRQAQSAVLEGIQRLKSLGVLTRRPDDYFAEMVKSDQHMHKVRENLAARQAAAARSEKISQLRKLKKLGKQTQLANKLKQDSEKKKMLNEVKKFKKGIRKDLNFLDGKADKKSLKTNAKISNKKRALRNEKFGFGGKKRGSKKNTKDSTSYFGGFPKKGNTSISRTNKRPGKSKRIQKKARK